MMNPICNNCAKLGKDCAGTNNQVWTGCIYRVVKESDTLEQKKFAARQSFANARNAYMQDQTQSNWIAFCDAKILCRRLGVIV